MRYLLLGTVSVLAIAAARVEAKSITVSFTGEAFSADINGSPVNPSSIAASLSGNVTFDPTTFKNQGTFGGEGAATGGTVIFTGLSSVGAAVNSSTFTMPPTPLDVTYYPAGPEGGTAATISLDTGVTNSSPFTANANGLYLISTGFSEIEITNINPNTLGQHPASLTNSEVNQFAAYFDTQVPEPASAALFGAGIIGLAGLRRRNRTAT